MQRLTQSLIFRAGITMAGITVLAIASMLASVLIANAARGDAAAIELTGALRAQAYRLAGEVRAEPPASQQVARQAGLLAGQLDDPLLRSQLDKDADAPAQRVYREVQRRWRERLQPALARHAQSPGLARDEYLAELDGFVAELDKLVNLIRQQADQRLQLLRLIQAIALLLTLGLVLVAMYKLITEVVPPLRELFEAVTRARGGDFSLRPQYRGQDEIGLLSHTYNLMADDLSRSYADLEQRVSSKTEALTRSNRALRLLYDSSRRLGLGHEHQLQTRDYQATLEQLDEIMGLGTITLCLTTADAERAYRRITSDGSDRSGIGHSAECASCLQPGLAGLAELHSPRPGTLSISVRDAGHQYGVILVQHADDRLPEPWQVELVEAVAAQIAASLGLARQREQQHRLALMDERAVIARELHDSLAQSLSYLRIQVTRLQTLVRPGEANPALDEVIGELRKGLGDAYRQLRELLTTFRLRVNEPGLAPALEATVTEFSRRGALQIQLDYRLGHCPLTANEEVHVLQIVREAMANIIHHAQADSAELHLETIDDGRVRVDVLDNGVGIPDDWQRSNHYGIAIMQERAHSLGGSLEFRRRAEGGTRVELRFRPEAGAIPPVPDRASR